LGCPEVGSPFAWREAEEIADIADKLPGEETLEKLIERLIR